MKNEKSFRKIVLTQVLSTEMKPKDFWDVCQDILFLMPIISNIAWLLFLILRKREVKYVEIKNH